jgi:hypothetical protein
MPEGVEQHALVFYVPLEGYFMQRTVLYYPRFVEKQQLDIANLSAALADARIETILGSVKALDIFRL